jgi:RNA polymerase sigma-70 factor (ECF subfamily)
MPQNATPKIKKGADYELVQGINAGRAGLFEELINRYEKKIYNFGLRMCGDVRDAEDMVQDTFLNVFKYLKSFRYETKLKNWIYRIAASACIKRRRKSKFAPERELSLDEFLPGDGEGVPREIPDWANVPLDRLLNEELARTVKANIDSLPPKYRMILLLRDIEGFSTAEAAQILDLTESNVKVRLHRARLYLRDRLKDYFDHDRTDPPPQ